ncbi:hypothetical protein Athai_53190 [Actinocatenispora thailandica]|uniref:Gcp-like domain-containing protein n=1 Tax=Actinocatenispora thailandica TaxID=227318 RepID=A0A7R7DU55_9ACTN|nr:hypothetical protein Athai_53190 [Actinocatenispora thailandica]
MLVLGVDTATAAVTAVLAEVTDDGVRELATEVTVGGQAHGERLAPAIETVLTATRHVPADLAAVVAGTGPGPFTGLRVGLVTATALGQTLAIPTYDVCTLDALGAAAGPGRVLVATDARRREIYWAVYLDGVRQTEPAVAKPADVATGPAMAAGGAPAGGRVSSGRSGTAPRSTRRSLACRSPTSRATRSVPRWSRWPPTGSGPGRRPRRWSRGTCAGPT